MRVTETALPGVLLIEPAVFSDRRGFFLESWNERDFRASTGILNPFVQDNHSRSTRGVLRGIHYQLETPQGKLVRVVAGSVLNVAVDLRRSSRHFGKWVAIELSGDRHTQVWLPPGFGNAFVVLSEAADFLYKTTEYRHEEHERSILWSDPGLGIDWRLDGEPILAERDARAPLLRDAQVYA